jgi:hypothetical protein
VEFRQNQGLTTVDLPGGGTALWFDESVTPPPDTMTGGWKHIGDPNSVYGYVVEAYQSGLEDVPGLVAFAAPESSVDFVDKLAPGELMNNSFTAITPDGQWLVSGEWERMNRLLVFPMPVLNPQARDPKADLPLVGQITLDRPVNNLQGCVFTLIPGCCALLTRRA